MVACQVNATPASNPMDNHAADMARLSLLIQRLLDADTLCGTEGAALLIEAEAAGRSLQAGDLETARRHVAQVVRSTEALVHSNLLLLSDARAVIETARRLLTGSADGPT